MSGQLPPTQEPSSPLNAPQTRSLSREQPALQGVIFSYGNTMFEESIHVIFAFKTHLGYLFHARIFPFLESNGRIGHLEEAARDLIVAVEMSEEDDDKANLCQKLVSFVVFLEPFF